MARAIAVVTICLTLVACGKESKTREPAKPTVEDRPPAIGAIAAFWHWFASESDRLFALGPDDVEIVNEIGDRLQTVHKDLLVEIGPPESGRRQIAISGGGLKEMIPVVQEVVRTAPPIAQWNVVAFRQPTPIGDRSIRMGDIELSADNILFVHKLYENKLDLDVYLEGLTDDNLKAMVGPAFLMLDTAIGEYDVMTKLGSIEFYSKSDAPKTALPLAQLPRVVGTLSEN